MSMFLFMLISALWCCSAVAGGTEVAPAPVVVVAEIAAVAALAAAEARAAPGTPQLVSVLAPVPAAPVRKAEVEVAPGAAPGAGSQVDRAEEEEVEQAEEEGPQPYEW